MAKGVVTDGGVIDGGGHAALTPASKLEFKLGPDIVPTADMSYFCARCHDLAKPYTPPVFGPLRTAFPVANRGAPLRKFHLRTFLTKQRAAGLPFETTAADFQLLLHASALLPPPVMTRLCEALASTATTKTARDKRAASIAEAERLLCDYAGL